MRHRLAFWGVALGILAACGGGGGGGGSGIDPRLARLDLYDAQRLRVLGDPAAGVAGLPLTSTGAIPQGGDITYDGAAAVLIDHSNAVLALYGDATLTLSFDGQNASGQVVRLFGDAVNGGLADYAGELALSGTNPGGQFDLTYAGTLEGGGASFIFDGTAEGLLLGPGARAFSALDLTGKVAAAGQEYDTTVVIFGEAAGPATAQP